MNKKKLKIIITLFIITLLIAGYFILFQKPQTAAADWFDDSWLYRQTINITNSGSNQTDFQVMITLDSATLITANKVQSDCDDIRITDISGKLIPHWIEPTTCNTSTTKIWTKVPSISTSGDTVYLYYGNSAVSSVSSTTDTFIREISGVQGAWDMDGTVGGISTGATLADSSGNTNTGTASNANATGMAYATGKVGQGVDFDGADDYVSIADDDNLELNNQYTVSFWVYPESLSDAVVVGRLNGTSKGINTSWAVYFDEYISTPRFFFMAGDGSSYDWWYNIYTPSVNNWYHFVITADGTNYRAYVNGIYRGSKAQNITQTRQTSSNFHVGLDQYANTFFNGSVDNLRIYDQTLSQAEISDLYGTGGDRQGYVTTNYPNKSLVRKYSALVSIDPPMGEERGPGPVAYWKFDEGFGQTANDSTINANNGTLGATSGSESSDPTWQTDDMCVTGKCLKFDGVDDYVGLSGGSKNVYPYSVSGWFKTNQAGTIFSFREDPQYYDVFRVSVLGTGKVYFKFWVDSNTGTEISSSSSNFIDNNWHYFSVIRNGQRIGRLYVDGVLEAEDTDNSGNATSIDTPHIIAIGKNVNTDSDFFNGFIDDVKIYPYARTASQIKADYASRGTASGTSAVILSDSEGSRLSDGLVGYWKMDEASWDGTADEVVDSSGSGNDGVAVGAGGIPTTGAGKFGNGGVFDGVDDYVVSSSVVPSGSKSFTVSVWLKTSSTVLSNIVGGQNYSAAGFISAWGGKLAWYDGGWRYSISSINDGNWHHAIFSLADDGYHSIYVDGTREYYDIGGSAGYNQGGAFSIIGNHTTYGRYFNGSIDEVRIYNRALSPGEVRDLYNWAPGPVAHWTMDEKVSGTGQTINDSSGYGNTGTTSSANGTGMDCMVQGKYGSACDFDGVDDYVNMGNDSSLDITNAITVEGWVKTTKDTGYQSIVGKGNFSDSYWFALSATTGKMTFYLDGVVNYNTPQTNLWNYNEWYHLVATYDSNIDTDNLKFYTDGILRSTSTQSGIITQIAGDVYIGRNSSYLFNGSIDDVRIYNYARTQAQILEDYAGGAGRKKQPIAHWKFDEGYGTTANNSGIGGSALNGTLTNMASPATSTSGWTDSGKIGKGLVFDGSSDYINLPANTFPETEGTISAWFKTSASNQVILFTGPSAEDGCGSGITNPEIDICMDSSGLIKGTVENSSAFKSLQSSSSFNDNNWHLVSLNWGSGIISLYIDGVVIDSSVLSFIPNPVQEVTIIGKAGSAARYFNGSIDDVKIYNFALTEDEVREEYNQGALLKLGSTGTDSSGNPDDSASREYCIPGDTSTCNPPVGRWDFNEGTGSTVNDISGNNNTGTWSGTGSHWTQGKIGKGGSFNGSDDYVDAGNGSILQLTSNFSGEAFVKINADTDDVLGKWSTGNNGWGMSVDGNLFRFGIKMGPGEDYWGGYGNTSLNFGEWYHLAFNYIGDGTVPKLYVNGIEQTVAVYISSGDALSGITDSGANMDIGRSHMFTGSVYKYFNGFIDQVRIYNYARTPAQIAWDYNRGKPIAHWKFDECQGSIANDASGNGNNGTITIGATGIQDGIGTCTDGDSTNAWYNGRTGKYNSAMSFDGSDDYVEISDSSNLDFEDFSVETWVKTSTDIGGIVQSYNYSESSGKNWGLRYSGGWYGQIRLTDGNTQSEVSFGNIADGTWKHLVFVRNGTVLSAYVDGVLFTNVTDAVSGSIDIGKEVYIGRHRYITTSEYFNGLIDEVKIYNYALTAEQVKTEYNQGAVSFR